MRGFLAWITLRVGIRSSSFSICKSCFEEHSDPRSKDSLVFCEDCKLETKNKNLKELKTIKRITDSYRLNKENIDAIRTLLSSEKYYLVSIN